MKSKLIAACMALAAFVAFALVPATASAIELGETTSGGVWDKLAVHNPLKTCTEEPTGCIDATSIGETFMKNASGTETLVKCNTATMTGYLTTNGPTTVTGDITSASFSGTGASGDCLSSTGASIKVTTSIAGGLPYCMKSLAEKDEVEVVGGNCTETARTIKFTLDATGIGNCGYETASLKGTFTTDKSPTNEDLVVSVKPATTRFTRYEAEGLVSLFCPTESSLEMSFTLETDTTTTTPIYAR